MICPRCGAELQRQQYEETLVFQCSSCNGYLVERKRLGMIKGSRTHSSEMLEEEASEEEQSDAQERMRCPRCRVKMRKRRIQVEPEGEFLLDVCKECDHIWFGGGELARFQLDHEQSQKARDMDEMRKRAESRTTEEKTEMEQRIANLPTPKDGISQGLHEIWATAITFVVLIAMFVVTLWLFINGQKFLSGISSVALTATLGWLLLHRIESSLTPLARVIVVSSLAVLDVAYLVCLCCFA